MKTLLPFRIGLASCLCLFSLPMVCAQGAASPTFTLAGTWTLVAADVQHPDGTRARDFGPGPKGLLLVDAQGRYSLQIFDSTRARIGSGDKSRALPGEYQAMAMGSSTHFGTLSLDPAGGTLTFNIENASFPNWEGTQQKRMYELKGDELSYRVVPRPNGDVPISVWRRVASPG